jgi:hypothetical protein
MRYWTSRLQLINPVFYGKLPPGVRGIALKNMAKFAAGVALFGALAKLAGADIEWDDPDNPNALKLKFGRYTYDIGFGLVQHLRYIARMGLATQSKKPGDDMKYLTGRYLRSKLSPTAGAVVNTAYGKNFIGEPTSIYTNPETWGQELGSLFNPISVENFSEAARAEGLPGFVKMAPEFFGIGVTRYSDVDEVHAAMQKDIDARKNAKTPREKKELTRRIDAWAKLRDRALRIEAEERRELEKKGN